jgi:hypothetical protein
MVGELEEDFKVESNRYKIEVGRFIKGLTGNLTDFEGSVPEFYKRFFSKYNLNCEDFDEVEGSIFNMIFGGDGTDFSFAGSSFRMVFGGDGTNFRFEGEEIKQRFKEEIFEYLNVEYMRDIRSASEVKLGNKINVVVTANIRFRNMAKEEYTRYAVMTELNLVEMYLKGFNTMISDGDERRISIVDITRMEVKTAVVTEVFEYEQTGEYKDGFACEVI